MTTGGERSGTDRMDDIDDLATVLGRALGTRLSTVHIWLESDPLAYAAASDQLAHIGAEVVVIGSEFAPNEAMDIAAVFDARHPAVTTVIVAQRSEALLERALAAGVGGFIDPLATDEEIRLVIEEAMNRARRRSDLRGSVSRSPVNRVIPILAAKGGVGKTSIAANLAVALADLFPQEVVIVDADVQFGDVSTTLGVEPSETIIDSLPYGLDLDLTVLKAFLTPAHDGKLYALAAPNSPAQADDLTAGHVGRVIQLLQQDFRFVIVDTAAGIDETTLEALDAATDLIVLTSMDVPSIRAATKELDALALLGMERLDWHLVLNRANAKVGLTQADVESTLGRSFDAVIPSTRAMPTAVNQGVPLVASDPRLPASKAIADLARRLARVDADQSGRKRWRAR